MRAGRPGGHRSDCLTARDRSAAPPFGERDMKDILNFINGEYVKNVRGKTFDDRNPVDNSVIGKVHEAGKPEVDAAVAAARAALRGPWGRLSVVERVKLLDE